MDFCWDDAWRGSAQGVGTYRVVGADQPALNGDTPREHVRTKQGKAAVELFPPRKKMTQHACVDITGPHPKRHGHSAPRPAREDVGERSEGGGICDRNRLRRGPQLESGGIRDMLRVASWGLGLCVSRAGVLDASEERVEVVLAVDRAAGAVADGAALFAIAEPERAAAVVGRAVRFGGAPDAASSAMAATHLRPTRPPCRIRRAGRNF